MFGSTVLVVVTAFIGGYRIIHGSLQTADLLALVLVIPNVASSLFSIPLFITHLKEVNAKLTETERLLQKPEYQHEGKKIDIINSIRIHQLFF